MANTAKKANHKTISDKQRAANKANAQLSTGPRTETGKANSKTNATKHGCNTGFLDTADPEFQALGQQLKQELQPKGALELDCVNQICDSAWRLRKIREYMRDQFDQTGEDPLNGHQLRQLNRHRSAAEMSLHRAINALRDLQTLRLGRVIHLAKIEETVIGPLASPNIFAFINIDEVRMGRGNRELHYEYEGITTLRE